MNEKTGCPRCGKPAARDDLMGLCADCLLAEGLGSVADATAAGHCVRFVPPEISEIAELFPQLEILEPLGCGGMGAVYKARQKNLDRFVALKILPPDIGRDPAFAARFTREAKALAKLSHTNIVTLYEFGQEGELFYFLMEYVDGVNLGQLLRSGRVSPREALAIVPQICDALQYAHDAGIVHRDIKPENILLDRKGRVKVADFGLAKLVSSSGMDAPPMKDTGKLPVPPETTHASLIMGTPQYMAPEQVAHPSDVDHRADIYSLGVVFYQMLTGELPKGDFAAPSKKVIVDVRLDEVVLRAMEKRPELRYQQVSDVKTMVETIATAQVPTNTGVIRIKEVAGGAILLLACFWTFLSHDISAIRFEAPWSENVFRWDKVSAMAISFGLLSLGSAIWVVRKNNTVRVMMSTLVVWLLLLVAVLWSAYTGSTRAGWQLAADLSVSQPNAVVPAITHVEVAEGKTVITGCGAPDARFVLQVGKGSLSCGFLNGSPFTAIIERKWWGGGFNCAVKDAHGNVLLNVGGSRVGPMIEHQRGRIVFRKGSLVPQPDGFYLLGEFITENGLPFPISVRLEREREQNATAHKLSFGPVIERVLPFDRSFIDFQTGSILQPDLHKPAPVSPEQWDAWIKQTGADAEVEETSTIPQLNADDFPRLAALFNDSCVFVAEEAAYFDSAQAGDANARLQIASEGKFSRGLAHSRTLPWWFRTKDGAVGVLQIVGTNDNPRGLKIRYKLLQETKPRDCD